MNLLIPTFVLIALMAPIGFGLGVLYFAALRRTAELLALHGVTRSAIAFTVGRGVAAVGVFGFATWLGAGPLLVTFTGFLAARWLALRRARMAL